MAAGDPYGPAGSALLRLAHRPLHDSARSTWDVALAAARAGPHSPPGDRLPAARAAATPQTAPPSGSPRGRPESGRAGGGGAEGRHLARRARKRKHGSARPRETPWLRGPGLDKTHRGASLRSAEKKVPWLQLLLVARGRKGREQMPASQARGALGLFEVLVSKTVLITPNSSQWLSGAGMSGPFHSLL